MYQKRIWILLLPLGAVLMALCLIFPAIGALQWLAMLPALLYLFGWNEQTKPRLRRMYGMGLLYFYCFYLVNWHWSPRGRPLC